MIRVLGLLLVLSIGACSCSSAPVQNAQWQVEALKRDFRTYAATERAYDERPDCPATVACADADLSLKAAQAHYRADHALVTADSERTQKALDEAWLRVKEFEEAAGELQ